MAYFSPRAATAALVAGLTATVMAYDGHNPAAADSSRTASGVIVTAPGSEVRHTPHGVGVRAPYAKIGSRPGRTRVKTRWSDVDVSRRGVAVRAPFVNIFIPR